jgi:transposase
MRKPLFVRDLTDDERQALEAGLRSPNSFTMRRCQILLASSRGQSVPQLATALGCTDQTVRNAIAAFHSRGLAAIRPASKVAHHLPHAVFDPARPERLRNLLHQSPRSFGHATSVWSLPLAAKVAFAQGITPRKVSAEAIRLALKHLGVSWKRAKHWISSPDPAYARKKSGATG